MKSEPKRDLILTALKERPNQWIDLPHLMAVTNTYDVRSRVCELRSKGHDIENKIVRSGRTRHSFYRLNTKGQTDIPFVPAGFNEVVIVDVSRHGVEEVVVNRDGVSPYGG